MEKYKEQKSKIKTVSIRSIYEWLSDFLFEMKLEFKYNNELSMYLKENIIQEYGNCRVLYLKYVSLRRKSVLKILEIRKELCDKLLKLIDDKGFINQFKENIKNICVRGMSSFENLEEFKESDSFKQLDNKMKLVIDKISDKDYENFKSCANKVLKLYSVFDNCCDNLKKDLRKIKEEKSVASFISAIVTNKNKISHEKETLTPVLLNYAEEVTTFVKFYFNSYRTILKKYNANSETSNYIKALKEMLNCWDNDYTATKIQEAKVTKKYCRELFKKLINIAKRNGIDQMYNLTVIMVQLLTKLEVHLKTYFGQENLTEKYVSSWLAEFNKSFGTISGDDQKKFLDKKNMENLYDSIKELLKKYNSDMGKYSKYINEFETVYNSAF